MSKEISQKINQIAYLNDFKCLANKCQDTCCANWVINVTRDNKEFYDVENPDIAAKVEPYSDGAFRMKTNGSDCINLKDGLCALQQKYGETHLPDVCYTFPRSYKKVLDTTYMTANLACPESLRVALYNNKKTDFSSWTKINQTRTKSGLYYSSDTKFSDLEEDEMIGIFNNITQMIDDKNYTCDQALAKLLLLSRNMDQDSDFKWGNIGAEIADINLDQILKISQDNIESTDMAKELNHVLEAMFDLVNRDRPRYNVVVKMVREILGDHETDEAELLTNYEKIYEDWQVSGAAFDQILKNLIKAQLSYILFPTNCYFNKKYQAILVVVLEYLVIKLAVMCESARLKKPLTEAELIDVVQPTAKRFFVRKNQELYDFCRAKGWDDLQKMITVILNFS